MSTVYPESFAVFEAKSHTFMQAGKKKKNQSKPNPIHRGPDIGDCL